MAFKLFEFQEQFIIDTFFIKSTQLQKTGSIGKFFIQLRNQNKKSTFEIRRRSFFRDLYTFAIGERIFINF